MQFRVEDPFRLLAIAVISVAVEDARGSPPDCVQIDQDWLDLADVDPRWAARAGVQVVESLE